MESDSFDEEPRRVEKALGGGEECRRNASSGREMRLSQWIVGDDSTDGEEEVDKSSVYRRVSFA